VANGREYFELVLRDPSRIPKDMEFESLLYVARNAYERKTRKEWDFASAVSYETFANEAGWAGA
jgi:hypothetical protein